MRQKNAMVSGDTFYCTAGNWLTTIFHYSDYLCFSILAFVNGMQFQSRFLLEFRIILQNFMTRHFIKLL